MIFYENWLRIKKNFYSCGLVTGAYWLTMGKGIPIIFMCIHTEHYFVQPLLEEPTSTNIYDGCMKTGPNCDFSGRRMFSACV